MEAPTKRNATPVIVLAIAGVALCADQLTKLLAVARLVPGVPERAIGDIVYWTLERNPGAAFSLFTKVPWLFTIIAFAISIAILVSLPRVRGTLNTVALGLVLGGALGNLVDRIVRAPAPFRGHVVDFIDLRFWPVFNVADSCVVVGASLLVIASLRDERARKERVA